MSPQPALQLNVVTAARLASFSGTSFNNASDIEQYFREKKGRHFLEWFNRTLADQGEWTRVRLVDTPVNRDGFRQFWDHIPDVFGGPVGVVPFTCLTSIMANEVRADFTPQAERMGAAGHPGMAYLFDVIPGTKKSYNTLSGNRTAHRCFHDPVFLAAHRHLALGALLANTADTRWAGDRYPSSAPTSPNVDVSGMITQADFMKFRGRGFIQTTGRANYLALVRFVQSHAGNDATLGFFRAQWRGKAPDNVASASTNDDWDRLFRETGLTVATEAIRLHSSQSGNYLQLATTASGLNGTGAGSVHNMGRRISGSTDYANRFARRVAVVLEAIAG